MTATAGRRAALRRLIGIVLAATAVEFTVGYGKEGGPPVCVDPTTSSVADRKRRKLDNYTEKSPDPAQTCSGCRFFTAGTGAAACGQCEIFNGPANPHGRCDDWTAR